MTASPLHESVRGYADSMTLLCEITPSGVVERAGDAHLFITGAPLASLNALTILGEDWTVEAVEALSRRVPADQVWSIMLRLGADGTNASREAELAELAARLGLADRSETPFLVCTVDAYRPRHRAHDVEIAASPAHRWAEYTTVLAEGFETTPAEFGTLMAGGVLDEPSFTGYLATRSGRPVGTGLGVRSGRSVGIFNIAVTPEHRSAGAGRAITERAVDDAFAAGATVAYLMASAAGQPLYESMGFRQEETWVSFS